MKALLKKVPIIGPILTHIYRRWICPPPEFPGSAQYWEQRYYAGGDSGAGSRDALAEYKAGIVNAFIEEHGVANVVDLGCGDGRVARLLECPSYLGFDISAAAVSRCQELLTGEAHKTAKVMDAYDGERGDLGLSLDVVYHLIEDEVFDAYMTRLFDSADRFVVVHSSNTCVQRRGQAPHVKHREFTRWVQANRLG